MKLKVHLYAVIGAAAIFALSTGISAQTIKVGLNIPLTGDIPKVGEGSKFAAQMWLADVNAAGGLEVGGRSTRLRW